MFTLLQSLPSPRVTLYLILVLGSTSASHVETVEIVENALAQETDDYGGTINEYRQVSLDRLIDRHLESIHEILVPLDPLKLKNVQFPVTSKMYMNLLNGWMQNLSLLKRTGPCHLEYTQKKLTANLSFGWDRISVDYRYLLKMYFLKRRGDLHMVLSNLKVNVVIEIDFNTYQVILQRMEFFENGKISISLEGHLTDKIYNLIIKAVTSMSRDLVFKTIEKKVTEVLQREIDSVNHIIDGHHNHPFTFINLVSINRSRNFLC